MACGARTASPIGRRLNYWSVRRNFRQSSIEASPYRARASRHPVCAFAALGASTPPLQGGALHKKSWAVIDRPYSLGCATVGALYERPPCIFCAKQQGEDCLFPNHY